MKKGPFVITVTVVAAIIGGGLGYVFGGSSHILAWALMTCPAAGVMAFCAKS